MTDPTPGPDWRGGPPETTRRLSRRWIVDILRGTLAMARTNDINSATAQFFINLVDNDFLDHSGPANYGYAVFGKVTSGMDVVKKIEKTPTGQGDRPRTPVQMIKVTINE